MEKSLKQSYGVRNVAEMSTIPTPYQYCAQVVEGTKEQGRNIKGIQIGNQVKLSTFAFDIILYIRGPKFYQNSSAMINRYSNVAGYRINLHMSIVSLFYFN